MDAKERLAIEVNEISIAGSAQEGVFGNPKDLEQDEEMRDWIAGLREGGGGGCVLIMPSSDRFDR